MTVPHPVALISGGSKGLGLVLCRRLLAAGHPVATFSRSRSAGLDELLAAHPDRMMWKEVDVADFDGTAQFVNEATDRLGPIGVLVNNAGTMRLGTLPMLTPKDIHALITTNFEAAIHLTRSVVRQMVRHKFGSIVNISTVNSIRGYRGVSVYAGSKAAMDAVTRSLARELGSRGVRVNSVCCGYFESELTRGVSAESVAEIKERTPLHRVGTVDDMANAVMFLLSPSASFISGQILAVDGGLTS